MHLYASEKIHLCSRLFICYQIDRIGHSDQVLEDEVRYRYSSVILHYRKSFIQEHAQRYLNPFSVSIDDFSKCIHESNISVE